VPTSAAFNIRAFIVMFPFVETHYPEWSLSPLWRLFGPKGFHIVLRTLVNDATIFGRADPKDSPP
jgi:hypothetical protein